MLSNPKLAVNGDSAEAVDPLGGTGQWNQCRHGIHDEPQLRNQG